VRHDRVRSSLALEAREGARMRREYDAVGKPSLENRTALANGMARPRCRARRLARAIRDGRPPRLHRAQSAAIAPPRASGRSRRTAEEGHRAYRGQKDHLEGPWLQKYFITETRPRTIRLQKSALPLIASEIRYRLFASLSSKSAPRIEA